MGILSPSWPGLSRPSAHRPWGADGRDKPGHDGEGVRDGVGVRDGEGAFVR